jgi:hypothetical protein
MQTTAVVSNCMAYVSNVHLRVLLGVHHSRNGDTEVGDRAPEVYMIIVRKTVLQASPKLKTKKKRTFHHAGQTIILSSFFPSASLMADLGLVSGKCGEKLGAGSERTGRADIVRNLVGADLGVDSLDSSSHDELLAKRFDVPRLGLGSAGDELVDSTGVDRRSRDRSQLASWYFRLSMNVCILDY